MSVASKRANTSSLVALLPFCDVIGISLPFLSFFFFLSLFFEKKIVIVSPSFNEACDLRKWVAVVVAGSIVGQLPEQVDALGNRGTVEA